MAVRLYLNPLGVVVGYAARRGIEEGWALRLAGDGAAFTGCEIWLRGPEGTRHDVLAAGELAGWLDDQTAEVSDQTTRWCDRLGTPCSWPEALPRRCPVLMGVVNVTPDSFSDGGRFLAPAAAIAQGLRLHAEGADVVDVGGESTRPGAERPPTEEELRRVLPVVRALADAGAVVSVDTMRAEVVEQALAAGARIINDVSGGLADDRMLEVAASADVPFVVMHWRAHSVLMQNRAEYADVVGEVVHELSAQVRAALDAGIKPENVIVDPGLGFSKTGEHNWTLLAHLDRLLAMDYPVLVAASRKRFLGALLAGAGDEPRPPLERDPASVAITTLSAARGAWCVRVHDVGPNADAVRVVSRWAAETRQVPPDA
jgi:dihydropteroate synthase